MRIALAQLLPAWDDPAANLAAVNEAARRAADAGAELGAGQRAQRGGAHQRAVAAMVGAPTTRSP